MTNTTEETLELIKVAQSDPNSDLAKTISIATGLTAYDLQAPSKNLYPVLTPIRNSIPRVGGGTGPATNWRSVMALNGSGFDGMGWVPEGQRSGQMSYTTATKAATYVTLGEEDAATYEAISAGRGFEDIQARMAFRLLQKMMLKEEMAILAGNAGSGAGGISLGVPATPTVSAVTDAASALATATNYVKVVALTAEGFQNSGAAVGMSNNTYVLTNSDSVAVPTTKTITGADGKTFVLSGGSSAVSLESSGQATTVATNSLGCSVTAIQGAVAYAWFVGATGAETLQAITTINSYVQRTALSTGNQAQAAVTTDNSANASYAFNGLLTTAFAAGSNAYVKSLATGTLGTGTPLTSSGQGTVNEIDTMFQQMWAKYQLSPTVLYVNAQETKNIIAKVLNGSSSPLLRYDVQATNGGEYEITAGGRVAFYYNPYAVDTGMRIPIRIHPRVPPGTIVGWCQNLPVQYQSNEVPNVAEVKTRQDYYQIDWPITTRQRQVGVYAEEVLAVYAPFAMGVITNIGNG